MAITVNKNGLTGQSAVMAGHLERFVKEAEASGDATRIARAKDKADNFNSLGSEDKYKAGTYKPTQVTDYRAGAGSKVAGSNDYRYDERTGKEYGNKNLIDPEYDLVRDNRYSDLGTYLDQRFRDEHADLVNSGQLDPSQETKDWFFSFRNGAESKLMEGYHPNGQSMKSNAFYYPDLNAELAAAAPVIKPVYTNPGTKGKDRHGDVDLDHGGKVTPLNPAYVGGSKYGDAPYVPTPPPAFNGLEPKSGPSYGDPAYGKEIAQLIALARNGGFGAAEARRKLLLRGIDWE